MSTPLTGQAVIVHDNLVSIASALQQLKTNLSNGIGAIASSGDGNSIAALNALNAALPSSLVDRVVGLSEGYAGASKLNGV